MTRRAGRRDRARPDTGAVPVPLAVSVDASAVPAQPVGAGRYTVELIGALSRRRDVHLTLWCRRGDRPRWDAVVAGDTVRLPGERRPAADQRSEVELGAPAEAELGARAEGPSASEVVDEVPVPRPARLVWEQTALPVALWRRRLDVHHGPHYTMPALAPVPSVVTIHDLTFVDHPEWHEPSKVLVFRRAIWLARHRATAVVCVSDATARRFDETGGARGRVFVVPHGIDHRRFRPTEPAPGADQAVLARVGVRSPYVLFLGTVEPRKAVDVLLRAFDEVAAQMPDLTLVLAGRSGWGGAEVEAALASMVHRGRVLRTGYVPDATVPALLRQASAVCYPALQEGFGLPALEAVACGAPLVTTAGSVMAEMVGPAAVLAEGGSVGSLAVALHRALAGGPSAARRRQAGLAVAATHTWEATAAGHVAAYRFAAGRRM